MGEFGTGHPKMDLNRQINATFFCLLTRVILEKAFVVTRGVQLLFANCYNE